MLFVSSFRLHLQNWRTLNQYVQKFVKTNCSIYETDALTEQIFRSMTQQVQELTKTLKDLWDTISGKQSHTSQPIKLNIWNASSSLMK